MYITCLDLEGVLVPEIWVAFSQAYGIPELHTTTRDDPDYHKLMNRRIAVLKQHKLGLPHIQQVIAQIEPLPGAREFLDALRAEGQVIIISDTFAEFAAPLMKKLGWPTIFCNELETTPSGEITGFKIRIPDSKLTAVRALQSIGYQTIACGDSYNDLAMIEASTAGFLFRTTGTIRKDHPQINAYTSYDDLLAAIRTVVQQTTQFQQRSDCGTFPVQAPDQEAAAPWQPA